MLETIQEFLEGKKTYIIAGFLILSELLHFLGVVDSDLINAIRVLCYPALGITLSAKINRLV